MLSYHDVCQRNHVVDKPSFGLADSQGWEGGVLGTIDESAAILDVPHVDGRAGNRDGQVLLRGNCAYVRIGSQDIITEPTYGKHCSHRPGIAAAMAFRSRVLTLAICVIESAWSWASTALASDMLIRGN